jgi:hypothetical protein
MISLTRSGLDEITGIFMLLNTQLVVRDFFQGVTLAVLHCINFVIWRQGMYPIIVVILVEKNRSLNTTFCSFGTTVDVRGGRMPVEPMSFAPGPVLASGGRIDLAPRSPNADIHVSFMELGNEGMSVGRHKVSSEEHPVS